MLDMETGISHLDLQPGEVLPFALQYIVDKKVKGCAIRAVQFSVQGTSRKVIGGQTFIIGEVEGITTQQKLRSPRSFWLWLTASVSFLTLFALFGRGKKK